MEDVRSNWLTVSEAAEYLRCGERFLRELVATREVPHVTFAGKALFHHRRLDEWLLGQEQPVKLKKEESRENADIEEACKISIDCPRHEVDSLVKELIQYKYGKERFVNGLGKNLKRDLVEFNYEVLSPKVCAQLSRWCHPRKPSPRNDWAQERAQKISKLMFGKILDRFSRPSYRS
jgi:excisionase family DNA binding protein